jgi:acetyl-CoA/propionyl-CoA carboxylase biotin carboxyl carrier protein
MNARLQVEHPVTELVTGLDLVEAQLRVAVGEHLDLDQTEIRLTGHAIEARINAEDADRDFLPAAGRVVAYHRPRGVRVDDAIEIGSNVDTAYDSLLAKVIVHAPDRPMALGELDRALAHTSILGVTTTTGFLRSLIATKAVRDGQLDTGMIERVAVAPGPAHEEVARVAALISVQLLAERAGDDPFARADGWRLGGGRAGSWWRLSVAGEPAIQVALGGDEMDAARRSGPDAFTLTIAGRRQEWNYAEQGEVLWVGCGGWAWAARHQDADQADAAESSGDLRAPMPGQVLLVPARVGEQVQAGDTLVVLESMKMELAMTAPVAGLVAELSVAVGDRVVVDQPLARVQTGQTR